MTEYGSCARRTALQAASGEAERLASRLSDTQSDLRTKEQLLASVTTERVSKDWKGCL